MISKKYELKFGNQNLEIEFSNLAEQANGSVLVKLGETCVLANVVMGQNDRLDLDFFPLLVDYEEKYYAAGKIYGSRFIRRESRPTEIAILTGRLIDRTIRPLFPEKMRRDVQVVVTCLSIDEENDPDILGIVAASLALGVSDIPFNGPVSAFRLGWSEETGFVINPVYSQRENLKMEIVVSGPENKINMLEGGAKEVKEEVFKEALLIAQKEIEKLNEEQKKIIKEIGKEKQKIVLQEIDPNFQLEIKNFLQDKLEKALCSKEKKERLEELNKIEEELNEYLKSKQYPENLLKQVPLIWHEELNKALHKNILENEIRPDGRKLEEVRPIEIKIDILKRLHGSALFMRGLTHAFSVVTLGAPGDALIVQGMEITGEKRFIHHYNFPGYSSGEIAPLRGPGRREIGHGALVERALTPVIPSQEEFPYTIRVVSEILSSNGSTSMASTCASSLALMAAGVPIKSHIAGIAMGLIIDEKQQNYKILTDIQGPEDHYGDMDFKVAGTKEGITALQMDMKVEGVMPFILNEALDRAKKAREFILEKMNRVINKPRKDLSPYAPRVLMINIKPERIGDLIGPGGKVIQSITQNLGVQIDIKDDGSVFVTSPDKGKAELAIEEIKEITREFSEGEIVKGKISQIKEFGAIVDLGYHREGLLHISELAPFRVNKVEDVVKSGEELKLKIKKIEQNGKISLSLKDVNPLKVLKEKDTRKKFKKPSFFRE
ncbi:MAG: polyribonucleotide nucleotidyltransferase [Minisyncoccia bacterium]